MTAHRNEMTWLEKFGASVLRSAGLALPRHVAIIMDGNRRYGKCKSVSLEKSYESGLSRLHKSLDWCYEIGVSEMSVYAFSIENFKRPVEEVDLLFRIFEREANILLADLERLNRDGIRVSFLGHLKYLPESLQQTAAQLIRSTERNKVFRLNFCIAYTSRQELADAATSIRTFNQNDDSRVPIVITEKLIDKLIYTHGRTVDLLIRTSGEQRLSDYYLWQSSFTPMCFVNVKWPEFSFWKIFAGIIYFQHHDSERIRTCRSQRLKVLGLSDWSKKVLHKARLAEISFLDDCAKGFVKKEMLPTEEI